MLSMVIIMIFNDNNQQLLPINIIQVYRLLFHKQVVNHQIQTVNCFFFTYFFNKLLFIAQPNSSSMLSQQPLPASASAPTPVAGADPNNTEAWQQYYQQYWYVFQIRRNILFKRFNFRFNLKAIYATTTTSRCSTTSYSNGWSTAISTRSNRFVINSFYQINNSFKYLFVGASTAPKQPTNPTATTAGNTQGAAATQASAEAWTQYW
jgi:hypothetical protein